MKKVTKLLYSFPLLLLFISGCVKKNKHFDQVLIQTVDHNALITPSLYVQHQAEKNAEQLTSLSVPAYERVATTKELFQEIEARFDDVSIPLGFVPTICHRHEDGFYIEGVTTQLSEECMRRCQQTMERFGWERSLAIAIEPMLVVYTKPGRICAYRIIARKATWFSKNDGSVLEVWFSTIP